jgi:hypothetical protein
MIAGTSPALVPVSPPRPADACHASITCHHDRIAAVTRGPAQGMASTRAPVCWIPLSLLVAPQRVGRASVCHAARDARQRRADANSQSPRPGSGARAR